MARNDNSPCLPASTAAELVQLAPCLYVGLEPGPGEEHPFTMVNGLFARTGDVRISPYVHALHYGTGIIGGTGGWHDPATGEHHAFRLPDTVRRLIANAQAIGLPGPFPDPLLVDGWFLTLMGLNLSSLVKSKDIYNRPLVIADGVRLGVGSISRGIIAGITRDLTDYLPPSGISLLFPGMPFRRPNPFML